ncbi:hypothetical protein MNB_SV-9-927 [hydrothermal vent metagenome]|uniref:Copper resistance protein D domain-containing protein n=1 Tax=hydrothermal vent metagenome TaxID=652676 RepID=A0A1W1CA75_9ZZZZ
MKQTLIELFGSYTHEIIFLHILSAIIWVGGMIAIRLAVHPNLQMIDDPNIKLGKTLAITGKFFNIVIPFIIILIITATLMAVGLGFRVSAVNEVGDIISQQAYATYQLVHIKEAVWLIMTMNFTFMYIQRYKAQKLFNNQKLAEAKEKLKLIPNLLLPINIALGIVALWLGVTLRGF